MLSLLSGKAGGQRPLAKEKAEELFVFLGDKRSLGLFKDMPGYAGAICLTRDGLKTDVKFPEDAPIKGTVGFYHGIHRLPDNIRKIYIERKGYYISFFMQCVDVYGLGDRRVVLFENRDGRLDIVSDNLSRDEGFAVLCDRVSLPYFKDRPGFVSGIYSGFMPDAELVFSLRDAAKVPGFPKTIYIEESEFFLNYFLRHASIKGLKEKELRLFKVKGGGVEERPYKPSGGTAPAGFGGRPKVMEIDLVNQCNIRCKMCHISYMAPRKAVRIEPESVKGVRDSFVQIGGVYEPMLHKGFLDIVKTLSGNNCELSMVTNATLLDADSIKGLSECNFYSIHISFDSAVKKTYEEIRRGARFEKVRENIIALRASFRGKPTRFLINMVVMRSNIRELKEMADFAEEAGFDGLGFIPMVIRDIQDEEILDESLDPVMDEANNFFDEAAEHVIRNGYRVVLTAPYYLYTPLKSRYPKNIKDGAVVPPNACARTYFNKYTALQLGHHPGMRHNCVSPFTFARVNPDGQVYLCNEIRIGNLREEPFEAVWSGDTAAFVRRFIMENPLSCRGCERYKYCLNPRAVNKYDPSNISVDIARKDRLLAAVKERLKSRTGFEGADKALADAFVNGDREMARVLSEEIPGAGARDCHGSTLLFHAALYGFEAEARRLIEKGAEVDSKNSYSDTPLTASLLGGHMGVSELLISMGADAGHAFVYAILMDNLEWASFLAERGADVNSMMNDEHNCLIHAAINNNLAMAGFLVSKGADINAPDVNGSTALIHASLNGHMEMTELLVEGGADVNWKNYYSDTPLSVAAAHGRVEAVRYLMLKGASHDDALIRLFVTGDKEALAFLVSKGASTESVASKAAE